MTGKVRKGQHLVAQGRHQQQVDLREDAGHFLGDFAPEAVGLHEVHGGEKAGLAENVGPGVWHLRFELIEAAAERELLESRGSFSEENQVEKVKGPVGNFYFYREHSYFLDCLQSGAVDRRSG